MNDVNQLKIDSVQTWVHPVNKTDATVLLSTFGTMEAICQASMEELTLCPGFGPQKAQRLYKALHEPFKTGGVASSQ